MLNGPNAYFSDNSVPTPIIGRGYEKHEKYMEYIPGEEDDKDIVLENFKRDKYLLNDPEIFKVRNL